MNEEDTFGSVWHGNDIYLEDANKQIKAVCSNKDIAFYLAKCHNDSILSQSLLDYEPLEMTVDLKKQLWHEDSFYLRDEAESSKAVCSNDEVAKHLAKCHNDGILATAFQQLPQYHMPERNPSEVIGNQLSQDISAETSLSIETMMSADNSCLSISNDRQLAKLCCDNSYDISGFLQTSKCLMNLIKYSDIEITSTERNALNYAYKDFCKKLNEAENHFNKKG